MGRQHFYSILSRLSGALIGACVSSLAAFGDEVAATPIYPQHLVANQYYRLTSATGPVLGQLLPPETYEETGWNFALCDSERTRVTVDLSLLEDAFQRCSQHPTFHWPTIIEASAINGATVYSSNYEPIGVVRLTDQILNHAEGVSLDSQYAVVLTRGVAEGIFPRFAEYGINVGNPEINAIAAPINFHNPGIFITGYSASVDPDTGPWEGTHSTGISVVLGGVDFSIEAGTPAYRVSWEEFFAAQGDSGLQLIGISNYDFASPG